MVKFIGYWMFASHLWQDAEPSPITINLREINCITECYNELFKNHVVIYMKNNTQIPIEGNIIEILAAFQKHLSTMY